MAKILDTNLGNKVDQKLGTNPVLLVDIYWAIDNIITYADRDYLPNSGGEPTIKGKILSISGLDNTVKLNGSYSSSVSVTISDADDSIKEILKTTSIMRRPVTIRHAYEGLTANANDTILLFLGYIASPVVWLNKTITFTVIHKLEDKEVGFSAEQGQFDGLNPDIVGKAWPLCIGQVKFVPTVRINNRIVGSSLTEYSVIIGKELEEFNKVVQEYCEHLIIVDNMDALFADPLKREVWPSKEEYEEATQEAAEYLSAVWSAYDQLVSQKPEAETRLKDLVNNRIDYYRYFEQKRFKTIRLEEVVNLLNNEFSQARFDDLPRNNTWQIKWTEKRTALRVEKVTLESEITTLNTNILTKEDEYNGIVIDLNRFELETLKVLDGRKFPQDETIDIVVNGLKLRGEFSSDTFTIDEIRPTFTDINIDERLNDDPNIFWLTNEDHYIKGQYCLISRENEPMRLAYIKDQNGKKCTLIQILYKKVNANPVKYAPLYLDNNYTIVKTSALILDDWISNEQLSTKIWLKGNTAETGMSLYFDNEANIDLNINIGDEVTLADNDKDAYIANCVPNDKIPATVVDEVFGFRTIKGERKIVPIPTRYYTKRTDQEYDQLRVTAIEMKRPLKTYKDEGWDDEVYVSLRGGVFGNSDYDVIDVIIFFITKYSTLSYDTTSFNATKAYVTNLKPNFALLERRNVISLIEDIAWQAKCTIWVHNNIVYIKSLAHQTPDQYSIDESDILEYEVTYTDEADLITVFEAKYRKWYLPDSERSIILRNNIPLYGKRRKEFDFFIYTDEKIIENVATFWLLRYSHVWKRINFKTPIHTLRFDTYDQIGITLSTDLISAGEFHAIIESTIYDMRNREISYQCWIPIRASDTSQYLWAFTADQVELYPYPFPGLDNYPGGSSSGYNITTGGNLIYVSRPNDYGALYPADSALNTPDPQATLGEVDYAVRKNKNKYTRKKINKLSLRTKFVNPVNGSIGSLDQVFDVKRGIPGFFAFETKAVTTEQDVPWAFNRSFLTVNTNKATFSTSAWQPASDYDSLYSANWPKDEYKDFFGYLPMRPNFNQKRLFRSPTSSIDPYTDTGYVNGVSRMSLEVDKSTEIFLAKIIGQTSAGHCDVFGAISGCITYDWVEVELVGAEGGMDGGQVTELYRQKIDGRNSTNNGKALNLIEIKDLSVFNTNIAGNSVRSTNTMFVQPVGGGKGCGVGGANIDGTDVIVLMYRIESPIESLIATNVGPISFKYVFQYENGVDGYCPETP